MSIKYDNIEIPNFIKITGVKTQVLPNIENKLLQAPRAVGAIDVGTNYGTKVITISFIFKDSSLGFIDKSEALASWLRVDNLKARPLTLPSHPDSYYLAKPNSSIELDDGITIAKGELEFICLNPFRIDSNPIKINVKSSTFRANSEFRFNYTGSTKTDVELTIKIESSCNNIKINFDNEIYSNYISLSGNFNAGDIVKIDLEKVKVYLNDKLDMSIWGLDSKMHMLCKGLNSYTINADVSLSIKYYNKYI